jgi:hypothetical protein
MTGGRFISKNRAVRRLQSAAGRVESALERLQRMEILTIRMELVRRGLSEDLRQITGWEERLRADQHQRRIVTFVVVALYLALLLAYLGLAAHGWR